MSVEAQLVELEAIKATYPEAGAVQIDEVDDIESLQHPVRSKNTVLGPLSGRVLLLSSVVSGPPIGLSFTLQQGYPDDPPDLQVICQGGEFYTSSLRFVSLSPALHRRTQCICIQRKGYKHCL